MSQPDRWAQLAEEVGHGTKLTYQQLVTVESNAAKLLRRQQAQFVRIVNGASRARILSFIYEAQKEPLRKLQADILAALQKRRR